MGRVGPNVIYPYRVQVPNIDILAQNLYYNYYYPKPQSLIIGYLDPLGYICGDVPLFRA